MLIIILYKPLVGISESLVTRKLKKLEATEYISLKSNNRYTVVNLLKWGKTIIFLPTGEQQANNKRTTIEHNIRM